MKCRGPECTGAAIGFWVINGERLALCAACAHVKEQLFPNATVQYRLVLQ